MDQPAIIYGQVGGYQNSGRQESLTRYNYITMTLHVTGAGASQFGTLIGPNISGLYLHRISAFYASGAPGGDSTIQVQDFTGGVATPIGSLTLTAALATYTLATATFTGASTGPTDLLVMAVGTDGGHRTIFATAYLATSPLRR